jgi:hypothetical protein
MRGFTVGVHGTVQGTRLAESGWAPPCTHCWRLRADDEAEDEDTIPPGLTLLMLLASAAFLRAVVLPRVGTQLAVLTTAAAGRGGGGAGSSRGASPAWQSA